MFKPGDKVVCTDKYYRKKWNLKNDYYIVRYFYPVSETASHYNYNLILLTDPEKYGYDAKYFMTISQIRKLKLKKLCLMKIL